MSDLGPDQVVRVPVTRIFPERREERLDPVVVEAPLAIELDGAPWTVTMRTPGSDLDLALGMLFTEGLITSVQQVTRLAHCPDADPPESLVRIQRTAGLDQPAKRNLMTTSACGVCGLEKIDDLAIRFTPISRAEPITEAVLIQATSALRPLQKIFQLTGALHGAALLNAEGEVLLSAEDVGRHNAVDKVIGAALRQGTLEQPRLILALSSRVGFEIAAKAWAARVQALVAVGAPSDLALQTCQRAGIQLAGFATGDRLNLYK
jgi:FdhD protein